VYEQTSKQIGGPLLDPSTVYTNLRLRHVPAMNGAPGSQWGGAQSPILPYMSESTLYQALGPPDLNSAGFAALLFRRQTKIPTFLCPSDKDQRHQPELQR